MAAVYLDPSASISQRVDDLLSRMTLEEKAAQIVGVFPAAFMGPDGPDVDKMAESIPHGVGHLCMGGVWRANRVNWRCGSTRSSNGFVTTPG